MPGSVGVRPAPTVRLGGFTTAARIEPTRVDFESARMPDQYQNVRRILEIVADLAKRKSDYFNHGIESPLRERAALESELADLRLRRYDIEDRLNSREANVRRVRGELLKERLTALGLAHLLDECRASRGRCPRLNKTRTAMPETTPTQPSAHLIQGNSSASRPAPTCPSPLKAMSGRTHVVELIKGPASAGCWLWPLSALCWLRLAHFFYQLRNT